MPSAPESSLPADAGDGFATFPVELRERLARRDPAALARFFDVHFDRVYAYLRRLLGDEHQAEDLTQEVFLHVQRALDGYDPSRDPRPWLFTIATNALRDHWRARAARLGVAATSLDSEELAERPDGTPGADSTASEAELAVRVRAAVDALPEGLRAPVLLRAFEGLAFEDVGRVVGCNEVAARKRYSRALAALRVELGELWRQHAEDPR